MEKYQLSGLEKVPYTDPRISLMGQTEASTLRSSEVLSSMDNQKNLAVDAKDSLALLKAEILRHRTFTHEENVKLGSEVLASTQSVLDFCSYNNLNLEDFKKGKFVNTPLENLIFVVRIKATKLALGNMRLLYNELKKLKMDPTTEDTQDLFSAGYQGLYLAATRWNPWHHNPELKNAETALSFSTYASKYVWGAMQNEKQKLENQLLPSYASQISRQHKYAESYLANLLGKEANEDVVHGYLYLKQTLGLSRPSLEEINKFFDQMKTDRSMRRAFRKRVRLYNLINKNAFVRSLDDKIGIHYTNKEGENDYFEETLQERLDYSEEDINTSFRNVDLKIALEKSLSLLKPREKRILELRFGLKGGREHTQEEVGELYHITKGAIHQIEKKAFRRLSHPSVAQILSDFLNN